MNVVDSYFATKANMGAADEFHEAISQKDIDLIRKAKLHLFLAPTITFAVCYGVSSLKNQVLMS